MFNWKKSLVRNSDEQLSLPDLNGGDQSSNVLTVGGVSVAMIECHSVLPTIDEDHDHIGVVPPVPSLEATYEDDDSISTVSPLSSAGRNRDLSFTSDTTDMVADLQSFSRPFSIVFHGEDDDLSMSSINTEAMKQIKDLRTKLEIQENTKLELLLQLQNKITNDVVSMETSSLLYMKALKKVNNQLREDSSKAELEFMNEMHKMEMSMRHRDGKIAELEEELKSLKVERVEDHC